MARTDWRHLNFGSASVVERQWMQQIRRISKGHAGEQREIIASLQESEVLQDGLLVFVD